MSSEEGGAARLTVAFAGGPVLAVGMQALSYAGVPWACATGRVAVVHVVPAAFVAAALLVAALAWGSWSRAGRHGEASGSARGDRSRFLALGGMMLSVASVVAILAMWVPLFVFDPCVR